MQIDTLFAQLMPPAPRVVAVAAAQDDAVLSAVSEAAARGIATPILCGDRTRIEAVAHAGRIDIAGFDIIETRDDKSAAAAAVSLVREGRAHMLMKGKLQTADLLRAVLNKETGLRGSGILSHVGVLHSPILERTFLLTDAAILTYPDLKQKAAMIDNAVAVARGIGIESPKVAALAAVEVVNPDMQATLDAAALTLMNRRGQIKGCVVDGPMAIDLALSQEAVAHKGFVSEVAGAADILLFHNIDAANSALKIFTIAGQCLFGGVVMGAAAPIVLTSRSDSAESKLFSILCAASTCR